MEMNIVPMMNLAALPSAIGTTGQSEAVATTQSPEGGTSPFMALLEQAVIGTEGLTSAVVLADATSIPDAPVKTGDHAIGHGITRVSFALQQQTPINSETPVATPAPLLADLQSKPAVSAEILPEFATSVWSPPLSDADHPRDDDAIAALTAQQMMALVNASPASASPMETLPQGQQQPAMIATDVTTAANRLTGPVQQQVFAAADVLPQRESPAKAPVEQSVPVTTVSLTTLSMETAPRQEAMPLPLPETEAATAASSTLGTLLSLAPSAVIAPPSETTQNKDGAVATTATIAQATKQPIAAVHLQETVVTAQPEVNAPVRTEEQNASKPLLNTLHPDRPMEVRNLGETVKTAGIIPRDLATEVAVSDGTPASVEQAQTPANAGQQHDTTTGQDSSPVFVQGNKSVMQQAASLTQAPPVINHESLLEQVKERLSAPEVRVDGNQIRLQLRPVDLGELQITLRMDDQKLRVEILAENKAVKTALLEHADTLKEILAKQHITVDRFDVGTGSNNGSGQLFREGSRPEDQRTLPRYAANGGFKQTVALSVTTWQPRGNALVDVRF